jgi:hypothetical protein
MQFVPGLYPIFPRVDLLQNLLSRYVVTPEGNLVGLRLKFIQLGLFLVELKDTPSAKQVASSVQSVFLSSLQT